MARIKWKEGDSAYSLLFFPFVGVSIGLLLFLINGIAPLCDLPDLVRILLTLWIPLAVTGGIHVDGFMDTEDALRSYADPAKKLEILKDPHIGAFAVIGLVKHYLLLAAGISVILCCFPSDQRILLLLCLIFVMSRCLSGLTSIYFRKAKKDGMLYASAAKTPGVVSAALILQLLLCASFMVWSRPVSGLAVLLTFAVITVFYRHMAYGNFDGVTGDTAGYYLTVSETAAVLALAAASFIC